MTERRDGPLAFDLKGITKSHRLGESEISILKGIDLQVPLGQFISIIGPSGSGKSTLMYILGCLDHPTRGRLSVLGQDVAKMSDDQISALRCRSMGFVFQGFHLLSSYDALSNVALAMVYNGRKDRWQKSQALLQGLGLKHRLLHRPTALSGGEQQRVAIARAMANNPQIILADEPTGSLDQANGRLVLDYLQAFHQQGKTVVLVTHDAHVAERAERIVELVDGQVRRDQRRT